MRNDVTISLLRYLVTGRHSNMKHIVEIAWNRLIQIVFAEPFLAILRLLLNSHACHSDCHVFNIFSHAVWGKFQIVGLIKNLSEERREYGCTPRAPHTGPFSQLDSSQYWFIIQILWKSFLLYVLATPVQQPLHVQIYDMIMMIDPLLFM